MGESVQEIKRFNRFYLRMMGLFSLYTDQSSYSATEVMILFEIYSSKKCTASFLSEHFLFDKGYISRMVKKFQQKNVIEKVASEEDRRIQYLQVTEKGLKDLNVLAKKADLSVKSMIKDISQEDLKVMIDSMRKIEDVLEGK
ncbi:MarR family winged helix-turn-helix transcriptional regulator [Virgibacillus byunsanensis]|uniref:MarR family winged helix-turn-helix transcriptional regulator n=1 Tax=Virgibacillus byunsanensis TaxID=570945 RepID=A0ABW3LHJ2_9BACI